MYEMSNAANAVPASLEAMYAWGLSVIHAFQAAGNPALTVLARAFSLLGDPVFYILLLPVIYWCVDEKIGFRLGVTIMVSDGVKVALKNNLRVERPFIREPGINMISETGFSTPSGHAQNSAVLWPVLLNGGLLRRFPRALRVALSFALPLFIGLSRIYLGVHYPTDVLLGWAIGALISCSALFILPALLRAISAAAPFRKAKASLADHLKSGGRSFRSIKIAFAAIVAYVLNETSRGDSSMGGMLFGFATGYILLTDRGGKTDSGDAAVFSAASGSFLKKIARLAVGLGMLVILFLGLKMALPGEGSPWYALGRFIRYAAAGFWASWGAPKLFVKTGFA